MLTLNDLLTPHAAVREVPLKDRPGSVYVLLRKYRKKGRIYWERMPADSDLY